MNGSPPTLGLIGAVGAGKSTAARELARLGGHRIDADSIGHEVLETQDAKELIVGRWGSAILRADGTIDRKKLGAIVFANPEERAALEAIVLPRIRIRTRQAITEAENVPFIVVDAPILLEAGFDRFCDRIVYIDAPRTLRLARLAERSGWDEAELSRREAAQLPAETKQARADAVVLNESTAVELGKKLEQLLILWGWRS